MACVRCSIRSGGSRIRVLLPPAIRGFFGQINVVGWGFVGFGIGGTALKLMDILAGFMIVRTLSPSHYALVAVIVGTVPVYSTILISGILPAIFSTCGRGACDMPAILGLRAAARRSLVLQNRLLAVGMTAISGLLLSRLTDGLAEWLLGVAAIMMLSAVSALLAISDVTLQMAGRQQVVLFGSALQSLIRLGVVVGLLPLQDAATLPIVFVSVLAVGCNVVFCSHAIRERGTVGVACFRQFELQVRQMRRRSLPTDIFQAFFGQFYYWVLTWFAGPSAVAGFAAVTRLGQITFPLTLIFRGYVVPGFARSAPSSPLFGYFLSLVSLSILVMMPLLGICLLKPDAVLAIIGPRYSALTVELKVYSVALVLAVAGDLADQLLRSRGRFQPPHAAILIDLLAFTIPPLAAETISVHTMMASAALVSLSRVLRFGIYAAIVLRRTRSTSHKKLDSTESPANPAEAGGFDRCSKRGLAELLERGTDK